MGTDRSGDRMRRLNREWSEKPGPSEWHDVGAPPPPTPPGQPDLPHSECVTAYHRELLLTGRTIMSVARVRADVAASEQAAPPLDVERLADELEREFLLNVDPTGLTPRWWQERARDILARLGDK